MALSAVLKVDGKDIKGESKLDGHEREIDLYGWRWGMTQSGTFHVGGGGTAGKVNVQDLTVTKKMDAASPAFMLHCCNGAHIDQLTLTIQKSTGGAPLDYVVIEMKKVMVTSVQPRLEFGFDDERDRYETRETTLEEVTFNFAEYKITYREQDNETGGNAGEFDAAWNIEKNREA